MGTKGYWIAHVHVTNPDRYKDYVAANAVAFKKYNARFLVRGGRTETVEGGWAPKRIVILEFPSMEKLRAFYGSPEYQKALAIRLKASTGRLIFVEGA